MTPRRIERALLSVWDKTGIVELAQGLDRMGVEILSTGGTARLLGEAGLRVTEVSDYTGSPEILGGRVKTLHPKILGGILARVDDPEHRREMQRDGVRPIDLVAVNLYPFEVTVRRPDVTGEEAMEEIDIGGVTLLRAAAKNHERVLVLPEPRGYRPALEEMGKNEGAVSAETRSVMAREAFSRTAAYDREIQGWFSSAAPEDLPGVRPLTLLKVSALRYGENPHQQAALYREPHRTGGVASARVLGGKEISYNNILDLSAAFGLASDLEGPACTLVKHTNPCGAAVGKTQAEAFRKAHDCDRVSAFGSIVAVNGTLEVETASEMVKSAPFIEALITPGAPAEAVDLLQGAKWGKSIRILEVKPEEPGLDLCSVSGGYLAQRGSPPPPAEEIVTKRSPTGEEWADLRFAWRVCRHVKSNAIVIARQGATVGIGAGQMSRVDSVHVAVRKGGDRVRGAVLASDGFFPFPDGLEAAASAGVTAAIQPGGSKRDPQVVEAADRLGVALVHTGVRHFLH